MKICPLKYSGYDFCVLTLFAALRPLKFENRFFLFGRYLKLIMMKPPIDSGCENLSVKVSILEIRHLQQLCNSEPKMKIDFFTFFSQNLFPEVLRSP